MKKTKPDTSWDDIIFENRNKKYGAYELRTTYSSRLLKSFFITVSAGLIIFLIFLFAKEKPKLKDDKATYTDSLVFASITPIIPEQIEKKNDVPKEQTKPKTILQNTIPLAIDTVVTTIPDTSTAMTATISNNEVESDSLSTGKVSNPQIAGTGLAERLANDTFSTAAVDKMPEFPGGMDKFYEYLLKKIQYTEIAQREGLKKKSFIRFIINEEGLVKNVRFETSIGYGMDEVVKNVLIKSPAWSPGLVRNTPVKTEIILPLSFAIKYN